MRALYRLCDCEKVTHAAVVASARQHTLTRIAACSGPVLAVHNATELDYTSLKSLGGHQNRKRDHRPGWLVLWRGWTKLQAMLDGYDAANLLKCGKT